MKKDPSPSQAAATDPADMSAEEQQRWLDEQDSLGWAEDGTEIMERPLLVIWDLDGTLLDSERLVSDGRPHRGGTQAQREGRDEARDGSARQRMGRPSFVAFTLHMRVSTSKQVTQRMRSSHSRISLGTAAPFGRCSR